jgi:hypothetical protein
LHSSFAAAAAFHANVVDAAAIHGPLLCVQSCVLAVLCCWRVVAQVSDVQIIGTQPWPIGRYGSCELMIGCIARATSYEVLLNPQEMEDVQWYDRAELRAAVNFYSRHGPLPEIQKRSWTSVGFFIPPPFAIAHHLINAWASRDEPWFAPEPADGSEPAASTGGASDHFHQRNRLSNGGAGMLSTSGGGSSSVGPNSFGGKL